MNKITKDEFIELINLYHKRSELSSKLYDLNIDIINLVLPEDSIIAMYEKLLFTEDQLNWFHWWIYERNHEKKEPQAWDKNGNPINNNIDELYIDLFESEDKDEK